MTEKAISPLRQQRTEDMTIRRLGSKTQHHYIRHVMTGTNYWGRGAVALCSFTQPKQFF